MSKGTKKKSGAGKVVWWLILLIAIAVFCVSGYKLASTMMEYKKADNEYEKLEEEYAEVPQDVTTSDEVEEEEGPVIDFDALKAVNEDVIGWLVVEALDISYPIVQSDDNDFYLHRTTEKTYNFAGSIFLDYMNKPDFSDCHSIVYGHNMKNGSMFGTLKQFRNEDVYSKSMYFWICTPEKNYKYRIFSAHEVQVESEAYTLFSGPGKAFEDYLKKMKELSEIPVGDVAFDKMDRVVSLSTCTGDSSTRFIVQGKRLG